MNSNIIIAIEGNIGSGKSTLLSYLSNADLSSFSADKTMVFLQEPVKEWEDIVDKNGNNILKLFYEDADKYAFSFQIMAYISRLALLKKAIEENKNAIIVTERTLFTDKYVFAKMLYDDNKISDINYAIYMKWFDSFVGDFPIHKVIYVKTDPNICCDRVLSRSRDGESNISLQYLKDCHLYHEEMLDTTKDDCFCKDILVIDGNKNVITNYNNLTDRHHTILQFIFKNICDPF
jgi:deoxyadenosine/deoxycytidine kinase